MDQAGDLAEQGAVEVVDGEPDQLVVVVLVGVVGRLVGVDVGVEHEPAGGLGLVAVGELGEGHQQDLLVPAGARRP